VLSGTMGVPQLPVSRLGQRMDDDRTEGCPQVSKWLAESLRLTCFPVPAPAPDPSRWWTDVVGEEPASTTTRLRGALRIFEGPLARCTLRLSAQPPRVDWELLPPAPQDPENSLIPPTIGPFAEVLADFGRLAERWFASGAYPRASRLALGATLHYPVESREGGYALAAHYLSRSVQVDPRSRELLYRINRRRASSGMAGLELNRLNTWTVMLFTQVASLSGGRRESAFPLVETSTLRLEMDVNTSADYVGEFTSDNSGVVFKELAALALEIAEKGDIP